MQKLRVLNINGRYSGLAARARPAKIKKKSPPNKLLGHYVDVIFSIKGTNLWGKPLGVSHNYQKYLE